MNQVAIAFSTYNRVELSRLSFLPLSGQDNFDLFWIDGSTDKEAIKFADEHESDVYTNIKVYTGVRGGSGAAIVFALSEMLKGGYDYVGLVENDIVLHGNWFRDSMALFHRGLEDGLTVGAVSARCYEDRILIQRDGYAVMHNLGAGMVIFSRPAAELVLKGYRTQWTTDNRLTFAQLSCIDIGRYWAFKGSEHWLCADWRWDALLASHGYASLALTPSSIEMIGQNPPLEQQGLKVATKPVEEFRGDEVFRFYRERLSQVRAGDRAIATCGLFHRDATGGQTIFAHQLSAIGGFYNGTWSLKDSIGFGPFGWRAVNLDTIVSIPVLGPCAVMASGGETGGECEVEDKETGFICRPKLPPEGEKGIIVPITIPSHIVYRTVTLKPRTTGITFYAVRTRDEQPRLADFDFNYDVLPPPK